MVYEDFYPVNDDTALIVCGDSYSNMNEIREVKYSLNPNGTINITQPQIKILKTGKNIRLGNIYTGGIYNNELIYSEGYIPPIRIQPYRFDGGLLYQTKGIIYLDDYKLIEPFADYVVVGRPTYYQGDVYFETRNKSVETTPGNWEVWKFCLRTKQLKQLLKSGANPYCYKGKLFYSYWTNGEFETRWVNLNELVR